MMTFRCGGSADAWALLSFFNFFCFLSLSLSFFLSFLSFFSAERPELDRFLLADELGSISAM
jgi:hypothetical protein